MSGIPGTFKNRPPMPIRDTSAHGMNAERWLIRAGALSAQRYRVGECTVMLAREPIGFERAYGWHLSIAHPSRYPSWDEIKTARYGIEALRDVTMAQILGPVEDDSEWVNVHDNCFHLYEITDPAAASKDNA